MILNCNRKSLQANELQSENTACYLTAKGELYMLLNYNWRTLHHTKLQQKNPAGE